MGLHSTRDAQQKLALGTCLFYKNFFPKSVSVYVCLSECVFVYVFVFVFPHPCEQNVIYNKQPAFKWENETIESLYQQVMV